MAAATLTSRLLGMVREIVYARFMGDGWVAGAFQLAFTIPNLFRRLLGEGALTAAFIPVFKEKEKTQGEAEMWRAANAVISGLVTAAAVLVALVLFGVSVALASHHFELKTELMLRLLRVMFPYMLMVCLAALFMGMLNARGHFFIPAMGATMLNVVMIAAVLWLAPHMGHGLEEKVFALAIGVLAAGVAQAAFQLPWLRREGFRYRWVSPWRDATVGRVVRLMVPGTIGVAAFQINVLLTQSIAFWVSPQIVASFNYAVRLMELPQGVFGISLATYLLPTLSGLAAEKRHSDFRATLHHGLNLLVLLNLIAAALLVALGEPIVRLLFERGQFTAESTTNVSRALICLAPGLAAFSAVNVLARAFYALGDTKTPMQISLGCLALNVALAAALIHPYRQAGLGLANTITSLCNVTLLFVALKRKMGRLEMDSLWAKLPLLLVASVLAGGAAWWGTYQWENLMGHATFILKAGAVFAPAITAGMLYWLLALLFQVPAARELSDLLTRRRTALR